MNWTFNLLRCANCLRSIFAFHAFIYICRGIRMSIKYLIWGRSDGSSCCTSYDQGNRK